MLKLSTSLSEKYSWLFVQNQFLIMPLGLPAQQQAYFQQEPRAEKGHWQLFTDYQSRNTLIIFYNPDHQVIYEETLAGRYLKLNTHKVNQINRLFDQIAANKLIAHRVKSVPLPSDPLTAPVSAWTLPGNYLESITDVALHPEKNNKMHIRTYLTNHQTKERLWVELENPEKLRLHITLKDKHGRSCYWQAINQPALRLKLTISELESGNYSL